MTTLTVTSRGQVTFRKEVLQHLDGRPNGFESETPHEDSVRGPRCTQHLERGEPEARGLDLGDDLRHPKAFRR